MPVTLDRVSIVSERLDVASDAMLMSWGTDDTSRVVKFALSGRNTLSVGIATDRVLTRADDPVLVSVWDNESDAVFDTL